MLLPSVAQSRVADFLCRLFLFFRCQHLLIRMWWSGARCSWPSLVLVCWSLFHSWGWLGLLHGHVGVDFSCGFCGVDFCVRILGCGFLFADFFADFVMACADFGVQILSGDFLGCCRALKNPIKKSHRKILTEDPVQEAFLHNAPPHSFWQSTADLLKASGCRCTLWRTSFSAQMASVREDERVISTCVYS